MRPRFISEDELEALIEEWHASDGDHGPLYEHLGLTEPEYTLWLESPTAFWLEFWREIATRYVEFMTGQPGTDERPPDPEPELQHIDGCPFPIAPCQCSRMHLIGECFRLRSRLLAAEPRPPRPETSATWPVETVNATDPGATPRALRAQAAGNDVTYDKDTEQWRINWSTTPDDLPDNRYAVITVIAGPLPPAIHNWHHPVLAYLNDAVADAVHDTTSADLDLGVTGTIVTGPDVGYDLPDSEDRTSEQILARLGHYTSTYCIHDNHKDCRETCKTCNQVCLCWCHGPVEAAMP